MRVNFNIFLRTVHLKYFEQNSDIESPHSQAEAEGREDEGGEDEGQEGGQQVGDEEGAKHGVSMSQDRLM